MSKLFEVGFTHPLGAIITKPGIGVLLAAGTTVPTDITQGYAPGCVFIDTNASAGSQVFINEGTYSSCDFNAIAATGAGSFSSLTMSGNLTFSAAADIIAPANTAAALEVSDGTTKGLAMDTRNTIANVSNFTFTGYAPTIVAAGAAHINATVAIAAKTITYTGTTGTTSQLGGQLHIGALTITDASAMTLDVASSVHIVAMAAAGGMLTITASRMISTSVSDAYLTNAGVWTDTMCWSKMKNSLQRGGEKVRNAVEGIIEKLNPATWTYKDHVEAVDPQEDGTLLTRQLPFNDRGRNRVGIVYDDLPQELLAPGEENGVAPSILASFALAAIKTLWDENRSLKARLDAAGL